MADSRLTQAHSDKRGMPDRGGLRACLARAVGPVIHVPERSHSPNVGKPRANGRGVAAPDADRGQNAPDRLGPVTILESSLANGRHQPERRFQSDTSRASCSDNPACGDCLSASRQVFGDRFRADFPTVGYDLAIRAASDAHKRSSSDF